MATTLTETTTPASSVNQTVPAASTNICEKKKLVIKPTYPPTEDYLQKVKYSEENELFLSDKDTTLAVKSIRNTIKNEEARLRRKFKFLEYQDALGLLVFLISLASMVAVTTLYLQGRLHWAL